MGSGGDARVRDRGVSCLAGELCRWVARGMVGFILPA